MRRTAILYILLFFILTSLIGGSVFSTYEFFIAEGPLTERKEVMIEKGMPLRKIAYLLKKEGVINSPAIFTLGVRASNKAGSLKAGEYSIPRRASAKMVMDILTGGQTYIRRITVREGLTSYQIVELLNKADGLQGEISEIPPNGTLLPETYYYSFGDTKAQLIQRMQNAMNRALNELWPMRASDLPFKTPKEAVILASIVEKETSIHAERNHVASVFLNRLAQNMRLQSDPTVIFALTDGTGVFKRKLWSNDLKVQHPYNTYVIYGLPPGPISNPGRASIEAVLHPFISDDLFFVADGTGGHIFASTYEEHLENVRAWREIKSNAQIRRQKRQIKKIQNIPVPPDLPPSYQLEEDVSQNVVEKTL